MIEMPSSRSWWMISTSSASSSAVRLLLGSSMMISLDLNDSALAISTICFSDTLRSETSLFVSILQRIRSSSARAWVCVPRMPFISLKRPRKTFSPTLMVFTRFNSW